MPTVFSHAIFSAALGAIYTPKPQPRRFWALAALCSVIPDLDVIAFAFGIAYRSVWGHRGITHSLLFALLVGCLIAVCAFGRQTWRSRLALTAFFSLATASHAALDALTDGGLGVALLAPFDDTRYFAPWRPIRVSPIGTDFFGARGWRVLWSELLWVWLPALAMIMIAWQYRRATRPRN